MADIAQRLDEWVASPVTTKAHIRGVKAVMRAAAERIRELEQENAALRAVAAEYDALIRHMDGGGDFHAFQRAALAASKEEV